MSLKPGPRSPNFEQSTIDFAQFTGSTITVTDFPFYTGSNQVILASGTGIVYLEDIDDMYHVKNIGTGSITVTPITGTIDGQAQFVISTQYQSLCAVFDGENWHLI